MRRTLTLLCPLLLALACSSNDKSSTLGQNGGSSSDGDGDADSNGDEASGDGDINGDPDGDGICEAQFVNPQRVIPDMLIVLDRSGSMKDEDVNRWDPSVSGLNTITASLDEVVRFGLMTFPGPATDSGGGGGGGWGGGGRNDNCAAGELDVPIALNNAANIAEVLGGMEPDGRTPTAATLENVLDVVGMKSSDPDAMVTATYVILVTDGAPNCMEGGGDDDEGAVDATVAAVEALAKAGTPTYVLGYDTKNDAELSAALDRMAAAGGTGDAAHRAIEDEASLIQEFDEIGKTAVSCDYVLDRAAGDPAYVLVKLDGATQKLGEDWSLAEDGRRVSLLGDACATLRGGGDHQLSVEVSCTVVNLL